MKKVFFLPIFLYLAIFLFSFGTPAFAADAPGVTATTLPQYINLIFNTAIQLAIILAVTVIIIGGVYYMVSLGFGKITSEGKEWVKAGILGLLIILLSYAILYTINPQLVTLGTTGNLIPILLPQINIPGGSGPNIPGQPYTEIPIGTLTETLLARTIDCFDFDVRGEPVDGNPTTPDKEPGLKTHDRVDCIAKLSQAIEMKAGIFSKLSEEIAKLMETCKCTQTTCPGPHCPANGCQPNTCPGGTCVGACVQAPCVGGECCTPDVKNKIEHGPIPVTIIEAGVGDGCQPTIENYLGLDEFRSEIADGATISTIEKEIEIIDPEDPPKKIKIKVIKKAVWDDLRLIDKLKYYKEKLAQLKDDFLADLSGLRTAENQLNNCYFAKAYVEFVKILEGPDNRGGVSGGGGAPRYCKGYTYANSQCFYTCQNTCNANNQTTYNCFKAGPNCAPGNTACLQAQAVYMANCVDNAPCLPNSNGAAKFGQCVLACRTDCSEDCALKYPECSNELKVCQDACTANSADLLANRQSCYFNFPALKECAANSANFVQYQICADNTPSCKYCSDQFAGDPQCLTINPSTVVPPTYSATYLFNNPSRQKIQSCVKQTDSSGNVTAVGAETYPEFLRCPLCSNCPNCSYTDATGVKKLFTCTGDCAEYAYSGDPLTFYCPQKIEEEGKKSAVTTLSAEMSCAVQREIPVGQTMDEAEAWADAMITLIGQVINRTAETLQYVDKIGKETGYCRCDSKCADTKGACTVSCTYHQTQVPDYDANGTVIGYHWVCDCTINPCSGFSCLKMINLLRGGTCPFGPLYQGVEYYRQRILTALNNLKAAISTDGRSEILKRLTSARQQTNSCSTKLVSSAQRSVGTIDQRYVRLFSCTTAENNQLAPIKSNSALIVGKIPFLGNCYGVKVGVYLGVGSVANNWFCCEKYEQQD